MMMKPWRQASAICRASSLVVSRRRLAQSHMSEKMVAGNLQVEALMFCVSVSGSGASESEKWEGLQEAAEATGVASEPGRPRRPSSLPPCHRVCYSINVLPSHFHQFGFLE
jgi:hypothetical protein